MHCCAGLFCNDLCLCQDCENRTDSLNAVFKARKFIMVKDPAAFKPKVNPHSAIFKESESEILCRCLSMTQNLGNPKK